MDNKRKRLGMTPDQIKDAFIRNRKNQKKIVSSIKRPQDNRPKKLLKLSSLSKKPQLLLDVPVATSESFIEYKTPDWFLSNTKADVSIIIPMFKSSEAIKSLIDSWDNTNDGTKIEVIFVDDCCPQNSKDIVLSKIIEKKNNITGKILYSSQNQGFGNSCNIGASAATGDYLIFLNADTILTNKWIRPITQLLKQKDIGIVGNMQLKKINGKDYIDSAGSEWSWETSSFLHIGRDCYNGKRISQPFSLFNCPKDIFEAQEREMVTGACLAIRKELFDEIGGFNPNYRIAYWEDSEICMVVKELGYKVVYQPSSRIYHTGQHSKSGGHKFHEHNRTYFLNKWSSSGRIDKFVKAKRPNALMTKNIVIQRKGAHGDVLVAASVAPALKKMYPDCKITFSTECKDVLLNNPYIDKVVNEADLHERSFHLYYNLDMAYEYRPKTNILTSYAQAVGVKENDCELFLHTDVVDNLPDQYIVVHAGQTNWAGRNWSSSKFDIVASQIQKLGHKIVSVGTIRDNKIVCDLDLRGRTSISQLSYVIKNSKMFVGIDSFPMHVAQTFKIPGVCFFGSIIPSTRLIGDSITPVVAKNLNCLGCHNNKPAPCVCTSVCETKFSDCINNVSVQQMMDAITSKIDC